jgi:nucleoside-diphosphate-sugar epimerase
MDSFPGKRLVIFGCGYVGGAVARQALARGMRVTALTRNPATAAELRTMGAEVVVADLAGEAWHAQIAGGADYVLDAVSSSGGGIEGYRRSYVDGMRSLFAWARKTGPVGTLVYTSSTSVYPQDGGAVVDERAATTGGGERAQVLLGAEKVLRAGREVRGEGVVAEGDSAGGAVTACRRYFILRLAGIYGPGRHALLEQVRAGEVAGVGAHRLNLIHRADICAAIWAVFAAPPAVADEIFNVADDGAAPKTEVAAWLAARIGVRAPVFSGAPAGGRRAVTPDRVIANAKLKAALGWRPRFPDFRAGYENVLAGGAD